MDTTEPSAFKMLLRLATQVPSTQVTNLVRTQSNILEVRFLDILKRFAKKQSWMSWCSLIKKSSIWSSLLGVSTELLEFSKMQTTHLNVSSLGRPV